MQKLLLEAKQQKKEKIKREKIQNQIHEQESKKDLRSVTYILDENQNGKDVVQEKKKEKLYDVKLPRK